MATITIECLMFRLPRELRDKIYDLAFATEHKNATIEFATARSLAPSINLLLTGRCIHQEAEETYQSSYAAFWSENIFVLPFQLKYDPCRITTRDVHHMKHIRMITHDAQNPHMDGMPYLYGYLDLKATDEDPLSWTISEWQAGNALGKSAAAGLARWMRVMSRISLETCAELESLKKTRLDEIIAVLWCLAGANSRDANDIAVPTIMRRR